MNAEKLRKITVERVEKFLSKSEWTDINLTSKIYGTSCSDSVKLQVWSVPNTDPNFTDKVSYAEMLQQPESAFKPAKIGDTFGPEWSTHWLKGTPAMRFVTCLLCFKRVEAHVRRSSAADSSMLTQFRHFLDSNSPSHASSRMGG